MEEWRAFTSLPAVLAVWAARPEVAAPEIIRDFQDSLNFGQQHIQEISAESARELQLPAHKITRYLTENIDYTLDEENLRGLRRYYEFAAELGLIREAKPLVIAGAETFPELAGTRRR